MKRIAIILVAAALSIAGTGCSEKNKDPLNLPNQSKIESVKITRFDQYFLKTDSAWIANLIEQANLSVTTNKESIQDRPNTTEYIIYIIQIDFLLEDGNTDTIFAYKEKNDWYVERPYQGIYLANDSFIEIINNDLEFLRYHENPGVYVEFVGQNNDYSVNAATIPYKIVNTTGHPVDIVLIPKLERNLGFQFEDKFEQIEFSGGVSFCGTADRIENEFNGEIEMNWFKNLTVGQYRLTFDSHDGTVVEPMVFVLSSEPKETIPQEEMR